MTGDHLRTCPRCGRRFSVTLWQLHAHNPEQAHCSDAGCGERAAGYCADAPLRQGLEPLCGPHLAQHLRWRHEVRFVDGGVCTVCNGRGRVPDAEAPDGRWARCRDCQGSGYASEQALRAQRRRAAEREKERKEEEEARRREEEVHQEDDLERSHGSTDGVSATVEAGEQATGQTRAEAEEHQRAAEERPGEERVAEAAEQQEAWWEKKAVNPTSLEAPAESTGERSQTAGGIRAGTYTGRRALDRHRCCCLIFLILLIVGVGAGGYHYWSTAGQDPGSEPAPVPTTAARATAGATPTPTPSPTPSPSPVPTSTPTPVPCADPTPTPTPTAPPAPTATPTPGWPPQPLSDAWREWVHGWSRPEVDAALRESIRVFEEGLDGLEDSSKSRACALVAAFKVHLETARHLVDAHRLGHENVPGQHAGISWVIWLRFQRELLAEAVRAHAPVADCGSLLATLSPIATAAPAAAPTVPEVTAVPVSPCLTAATSPRLLS